jgi:ABC-type uncharacterized transport system substrate-binding protein
MRARWASKAPCRRGRIHPTVLGWIENRTVAIEYRWAEGRNDHFAEIAAEFIRLEVDVILLCNPVIHSAKKETAVIPIVFAAAGDPVGSGLVAFSATGRQYHRLAHDWNHICRH